MVTPSFPAAYIFINPSHQVWVVITCRFVKVSYVQGEYISFTNRPDIDVYDRRETVVRESALLKILTIIRQVERYFDKPACDHDPNLTRWIDEDTGSWEARCYHCKQWKKEEGWGRKWSDKLLRRLLEDRSGKMERSTVIFCKRCNNGPFRLDGTALMTEYPSDSE